MRGPCQQELKPPAIDNLEKVWTCSNTNESIMMQRQHPTALPKSIQNPAPPCPALEQKVVPCGTFPWAKPKDVDVSAQIK